MNELIITRCNVCGIFAPQKLGYGGKIVSTPCGHAAWSAVRYVHVSGEGTSELLERRLRESVAAMGESSEFADELVAYVREKGRELRERRERLANSVCSCGRTEKGWTCRCTCSKCGGRSLVWEAWGSYLDKDLVCRDCQHVQDTWNC